MICNALCDQLPQLAKQISAYRHAVDDLAGPLYVCVESGDVGPDMARLHLTRRRFVLGGLAVMAAPARPATAAPPPLLADSARSAALAALERHQTSISRTGRIGIADFSQPSSALRFVILDLTSGSEQALLVAHGRGSDPQHSGWVQHFSNAFGSNATSEGNFLTAEHYNGRHGRSMRLDGLDPQNSNARDRAIVIHGAWYVSDAMVQSQGKTGRSEGCLAFDRLFLDEVMTRLGPGHLIHACKPAAS